MCLVQQNKKQQKQKLTHCRIRRQLFLFIFIFCLLIDLITKKMLEKSVSLKYILFFLFSLVIVKFSSYCLIKFRKQMGHCNLVEISIQLRTLAKKLINSFSQQLVLFNLLMSNYHHLFILSKSFETQLLQYNNI